MNKRTPISIRQWFSFRPELETTRKICQLSVLKLLPWGSRKQSGPRRVVDIGIAAKSVERNELTRYCEDSEMTFWNKESVTIKSYEANGVIGYIDRLANIKSRRIFLSRVSHDHLSLPHIWKVNNPCAILVWII